MDPFITAIVLTGLIVSGVWGSIIISGLLKRLNAGVDSRVDDPRVDALQEDHRLLESRIEQLEEEVSFFRELRGGDIPGRLPPAEQDDAPE